MQTNQVFVFQIEHLIQSFHLRSRKIAIDHSAVTISSMVTVGVSAQWEGTAPGSTPSVLAGVDTNATTQQSILRDFIAHYEKAHDSAHLQMVVSCLGPLAD